MDSASDEHISSSEERHVARNPAPRSSKSRASQPWAQQHFENIRNDGHSRTHIGNAYNTYHVTEWHHEETRSLTFSEALYFPGMQSRHDAIKSASTGSYEWLLQTPAYNRWRDQKMQSENYGLLWIKGSPGTGKSTIVKELLKRSRVLKTDDTAISYFFDAKVEGLPTTAEGMYQSLLFQMAKNFPDLETTPCYDVLREYRSSAWPLEKLKELFRDTINSLDGIRLACYIDAVDEVLVEGGGDSCEDILQEFEELASSATRNSLTLRVCVSSRMLSNALLLHSEHLVLDEEAGHIIGIQQLAFSKLGLRDKEFKLTLANCIASSSHGGYRWTLDLIRTLNKGGDYEDRSRLYNKLASMIVTTEVPEDRSRLEELQSSLMKIWMKPAQTSSAQFEAKAISDAPSKSARQTPEPKPSGLPPTPRRSTPGDITPRLEDTQNETAYPRSNVIQRDTRSRPYNTAINAESLETCVTREENAQRSRQKLRRHELRPDTPKRSSSPRRPLTSLIDVRRSEISTSPSSEGTAKPAHGPYTVPPQSSRPSGSRRKETVSVDDSDLTALPSSSTWQPPATALEASPLVPENRGGVRSTTLNDVRATNESNPANAADTWFYNLRTYSHTLLYDGVPKNPGYKPVRVAIIDSGFATASDNDDLPVSDQGLRRIKHRHVTYKNFTGEYQSYMDSTQALHGTWCASLLMQTAPNAELYVANVVESGMTDIKAKHVAAAIAWAIDNKVDIISMSFGWAYEQEEVDEQIDVARRKGILLFATASNDDDFASESAYPASRHAVFCVYSCSGWGASSIFNPRPSKLEESFMFPGEDLTILDANHNPIKGVQRDGGGGTERRTGTSYATPIAAGTAAMLLDLVRQELTESQVLREVERRLKKVEGMSAVLTAMIAGPRDGGYYPVRPWRLFGKFEPVPSKPDVHETPKWHALTKVLRRLESFGPYPKGMS